MSIVLVDKEVDGEIVDNYKYLGLSQKQWNKSVEKIVYRYFPDLEEHPVYILFTDFLKNDVCFRYKYVFEAFIRHDNRIIYIDSSRGFNIEHIARILSHELRHYHQIVNGELSNEIQMTYKEKHGADFSSYNEAPWETDACWYEEQVGERCYNILKFGIRGFYER